MSPARIIGIDLGTSNSAISVAEAGSDKIDVLSVAQLFGANVVGEQSVLPSAIYLPHQTEFGAPGWDAGFGEDLIVGQFAKERGVQVPDRLVTSAKSWLCHSGVDRTAPILPWRSEISERKLSPIEASTKFLEFLKRAVIAHSGQQAVQENAAIIVTVPASFDEVARTLTYRAAEDAGLGNVTLLEEPQAAFYSWIHEHTSDWQKQVTSGDIVLVCDVGGGTADFSLIAVSDDGGELSLERISVGEHILLGGDNMDLALAFVLRQSLEAQGTKIDSWQFMSLVHSVRVAKEKIFNDEGLEEVPISLPSRGSSLFAQSVSTKLTREILYRIVLEGFFPVTAVTELPAKRRSVGLQEFGLPYASEPVLSKHLAQFLVESKKNVMSDSKLQLLVGSAAGGEFLRPTAVLFNGGVFNAAVLRARVLEILSSWADGAGIRELTASSLDLAVARGAAYYGAVAHSGKGLRIKAGTARSFYIGVETSMLAVPGFVPPVKGLCVVPQFTEEGAEIVLPDEQFGLVTGEKVEFRFFSSPTRAGDTVGTVVDDAAKELDESACLEAVLPAAEGKAGEVVPVRLHAIVTPMGTLELWMHQVGGDGRWRLEFNVRAS